MSTRLEGKQEHHPASASNDASNPRTNFLSLPAELRNNIYEQILHSSCKDLELNLRYGRLPKDNDWQTPIKFLATCKQIRDEMLSMLWDKLTFVTAARWQSIRPFPIMGLSPNEPPTRTIEPRLFPLMQELLVKTGPAQCSKIKHFVVRTPWKYLQDGGGLGWAEISQETVLEEMQLLLYGLRLEALELRLER